MKPALTIAFFTGQSAPGHCALSPEQENFLALLAAPTGENSFNRLLLNFPYIPDSRPFRDTPLLRASWNNLLGYARSRRPSFILNYRPSVFAAIARATHTIFLAGSSGLELFNNLDLPESAERRCTLICYGPIARRLPRHATTIIVQGSRDFLSRALFRHPALTVRCNHLGYLRDPAFLRICQEQLAKLSPSCSSISA
ncbi:hypothetical protein CMV30_07750 [Nibricoccus aquaticus]|uniref:Alpha/beta hydrolase n=1 Tax=Nibricoccus aquaticus TaxID=2576891 RepID=A0A290Q6F8_9BACT|nr:hypothetical protein [Nibricoccus aquaticus]ATC63847.1 hypothetical protein CMV30_07750 [Nibricoccus aquaticus]